MSTNGLFDEEVQPTRETHDMTCCCGRTIGHRMPVRFTVHMQQDSHPKLAEKIERLLFLLDCGECVSGCRRLWTR